ncbi:hybrid sensor histidine kinase/response regulator [Rickettsiales bacterium]|nr:hybrid sensor histidine kinase/response regulator [Rickettsiales bacterium]
MFTPIMINGVMSYMEFKFIPSTTLLYLLFPLHYSIVIFFTLKMIYSSIKDNYKNKLIFYGFLIGSTSGTTNILPYMGIPIYPIPNFFISIYSCIIAYATIRHRIPDGIFAVSRSFIKIISLIIIACSYFFLIKIYGYFILNNNLITKSLFNILYFLISLELYHVLIEGIGSLSDKLGFGIPYKKNQLQKEINNKILDVVSIKKLLSNLKHLIEKKMKVKIKSFYIATDLDITPLGNNALEFSNYFGKTIDKKQLVKIQNIIKTIDLSIKYNEVGEDLRNIMHDVNFQGLIPFIFHDKTMGFILLESRKNKKDFFFYEDMELFDDLALKAGIALERIKSHMNFVREREKSLRSLAGSIAHEVRNPLNTISTLSSQIEQQTQRISHNSLNAEEFKQNKRELKDLTINIANSIFRTNQIINMTLGDLRSEEIDKSSFKLLSSNQATKKALKEYGLSERERKKIAFITDGNKKEKDFIFKGNETMFIYIIFNIIKNALYYLNEYPSSKIVINSKLSVKQDENQYNQIIISDYGPGVPKNKLETIFEPFKTLGKKEGTGLGLPFCRRIMNAFEGKISCESELKKYTKFIISFPVLTENEIKNFDTTQKELKIQNLPQKKILIVDDQEINLKLSKNIIERGLPNTLCLLAKNGKEALTIFKKERIDFVFMDLQMPIMDGFKTTKMIKKINKEIPVISHTSQKSKKYRDKAKDAGIDYYLTKPISDNILLRTLSKWLLCQYNFNLTKKETEQTLKNKRVISADDQLVNNMMLSKNLNNQFNMIVDLASTGKQLVEKYQSALRKNEPYDIILTDINMGSGISGTEASKNIREYEVENNIKYRTPIIAITGDDDKKSIHEFFRNGIDDVSIKNEEGKANLPSLIAFWINESKITPKNTKNINITTNSNSKKKDLRVNNEQDQRITKEQCKYKNYQYHNIPLLDSKINFDNDMIKLFTKSIKDLTKKIKAANNSKDLKELHIQIHALKGIAGTFKTQRLYRIMADLDKKKIFLDTDIENELDITIKQTISFFKK